MADKKIINLSALVTQASTDLYETSANGTGSYKETRSQMLSYTAANIATGPYVLGDLFYAGSTTTFAKLADVATGNVLLSGGVGAAPSYGKVTYGHMQTASAETLLGNPSNGTGSISEITLGAGLEFVGSTLVSTADLNVTLEDAYTNGDGTINVNQDKPVALKKGTGEGAGFLLPSFTTAEISAITNFNNSEMVWNGDLDRIAVNANTSLSPRVEEVAYVSDIDALVLDGQIGEMYFVGNATTTSFVSPSTAVKVAASAYSSGTLVGFTQASGTLTRTGVDTLPVEIIASLSATYVGSSHDTTFTIYYNGAPIAKSAQKVFIGGVSPALNSITVKATIETCATGDTFELWVENNDDTTSLLVQNLNYSVMSIGGVSVGSGVVVTGEDYLDQPTPTSIVANPINLATSNVTGQLPFANIANVESGHLLGRYDVAAGTIQEIQLGTNLSLAGDTLNSTVPSYYASQSSGFGSTTTTVSLSNTYYPIVVSLFNDINSNGFVNEVIPISGVNTPTFRYTESNTNYFNVNFNIFALGTVATSQYYVLALCIYKADTSIVISDTIGWCRLIDVATPFNVSLSGNLQLSTGDRVFVQVKNITSGTNFSASGHNASIKIA